MEVRNGATYRYRSYEFTITRDWLMWWCHGGIRVPHARHDIGSRLSHGEFSMVGISHEAGWGSFSRRAILRKLRRCIDRDIRQWTRDSTLEGRQADARIAERSEAGCTWCLLGEQA